MDATQTGYRKAVPVILALALAVPISGGGALAAQDAPAGGFSLPAGAPPQQQPPSDVQGPVDAESSPPRRTDEPAQTPPSPSLPSIAPVPVPTPQQRQRETPAQRETPPRTQREQRQAAPAAAGAEPAAPQAQDGAAGTPPNADAPAALPLPAPVLPDGPTPGAVPEMDASDDGADGSIWWWLVAGLVALVSLIAMALRQRTSARADAAASPAPAVQTATVPTPPLRTPPPVPQPSAPQPARPAARPAVHPASQPFGQPAPQPTPRPSAVGSAPFGTLQGGGFAFGASPARAPAAPPVAAEPAAPMSAPQPAPKPAPQPVSDPAPELAPEPAGAAASAVQPPRLLLDFTTLGVDVTLVNAIARYHLGITNMSDITVSEVALHGAVVQARRGMPPTIDPLRGDVLLPKLQTLEDIAADATRRCEGQIRLPLEQIEPIEMQGRLLFVPVVHIWIGYTGPDGTRYAVTQSFVIGEESSPPGPRVGPLRLDLGPRRFTEVGQRPLQPA